MNVADWLRRLGLEQYEALFRENDVGSDLLRSLTAEDLKELGIASVGHRRRLMNAVAALSTDAIPATTSTPDPARTNRDHALQTQAERRHITVLFCDIVGSTPLSTRLDPEDLRAVIGAYQQSVAAAVTGLRGTIARFVGDGALAYFGWPNADETHAESALRAGLAIIEAIRPQNLAVRIGVATGLVVVGDLVGVAAQQFAAVGETPNLAARLQSLAAPDTIVVSDATRAQISRLFEVEELGTVELKGIETPQRVWRVPRETGLVSRSEALYGGSLTPLIGRDEELELLLRRWRQAVHGEGQVVLLSGEPGIGKSRLIAELEQCLATEPHASLRYFCSPHHQESALHPVITRWKQEASFAPGDTAEERLHKLEAVLLPGTPPEDIALIAELLSVPAGARYPQLDHSPQRKKEKTFAALTRRLISRARAQPVLMLLEDAHWADPSLLELFDTLVGLSSDLPILLVVSFRAEFTTPWVGHAGVTLLTVSRLNRRQAAQLVSQMTIEHSLSPALLDRVVAQTDGVPLFIEELTKAVLEAAVQSDGATLAVPDTLQASLMARLDRLPAAKQVAQIGAVIGREFPHALLAAAARLPEAQLALGLEELVASGLAFRRSVPPDAIYYFKHALVQECAYDSLLRSRRADIHARIVAAAEADASIGPDVLAYHCAQAGLIARAANYYRIAGLGTAPRLAVEETKAQFERGLRLAASLPGGRDRDHLEAELLLALAGVLSRTQGLASAEAATLHQQAANLGRKLDSPEVLTRALISLCLGLQNRGNLQTMQTTADELLLLSETYGDARVTLLARTVFGCVACQQGRFVTAREHLSTVLPWCAEGEHVQPVPTGGTVEAATIEAGGMATLYPIILACLGHIEEAVAQAGLAVEWARKREQSLLVRTLAIASRALLVSRDDNLFRMNAEEQVAIAEELGFPYWLALGRCSLGWIAAKQGNIAQGLGMLSKALATLHAMGIELHGTWTRALMADALTWAGRHSDAMATLDDALAHSARTGIAWFDAELHRRKGELLLADPKPAEQELWQAIDIARVQSAKLFELRAAVSVTRLWSGQGRRPEARDLLTPIYAWFTKGFDIPDLQEANTLLAELGA